MVAQVMGVKVLHQPSPVLAFPEHHGPVQLVDQGIGLVFAQVGVVGTVGENRCSAFSVSLNLNNRTALDAPGSPGCSPRSTDSELTG
jgi:hypothetical protein